MADEPVETINRNEIKKDNKTEMESEENRFYEALGFNLEDLYKLSYKFFKGGAICSEFEICVTYLLQSYLLDWD